ncbi:MAG TPA: hypothetical protein VFR86_19505 [Burkholderiaceae bacterium]|nr:hypothetical protein [Burkholderiaceae bacterium]
MPLRTDCGRAASTARVASAVRQIILTAALREFGIDHPPTV